jgi:hypothetical protein
VIPTLFRAYRLELEDREGSLETTGLWFHKPAPMKVRIYRK